MKNTDAFWTVLDHNFLSQTEFPNEINYSMVNRSENWMSKSFIQAHSCWYHKHKIVCFRNKTPAVWHNVSLQHSQPSNKTNTATILH